MGNDEQQRLWETCDMDVVREHAERAVHLLGYPRNVTELVFIDDEDDAK